MLFEIYRYDPEKDSQPYLQTYDLDLKLCQGKMLLDALLAIKDNLDESLSFRRSCGEGVCGSSAMHVNGKNTLACITALHNFNGKVSIKPLPGMPVIRDLVVDLSNFYEQYKKVQPFLQAKETEAVSTERLQSPAARSELDGLYECILCGCCSSACPSYWWNPDKFLGPAASLQAARFIFDSRDEAQEQRLAQIDDAYSIFRCRTILNCADVCPKGLNPGAAIAKIRKVFFQNSKKEET